MVVTNHKGSRNCSILCLRGGAKEVKQKIFVYSSNDPSPYMTRHLEGCHMIVQVSGLSFRIRVVAINVEKSDWRKN